MTESNPTEPSRKKKFRARRILLGSAAVLAVCFAVVITYIWNLFGKPHHTVIPIVSGYEVSEGILDSLPDVEDFSDPESPASSSISSSQISSSPGTVSNTGGQTTTPVTWGDGRVRVYVDSRFPIAYAAQKDPNVENILIIGVDARSVSQIQSRTDSIIVLTIDKNHNAIKMTSFMRDSQVKIPGRSLPTKINAAYVYGGIGLLINTINNNFNLDIQKFAMVDMRSAAALIDVTGGVTINVTDAERKIINNVLPSTSPSYLPSSGNILLNGSQAVTYGRIRSIGTDTARTQRQRNVLTALIVSFKAAPLSRKMQIFEEGFQSFETNMTQSDMFLIAFNALYGIRNIQQYRVPQDGLYTTNLSNYNLIINFTRQNERLYQFIWGNSGASAASMPDETSEGSSSLSSSPGGSPITSDISSPASPSASSSASSFVSSSASSFVSSSASSSASSEEISSSGSPDASGS